MKIFNRLNIILSEPEEQNRAKYQEAYWALRKKFGIKDGNSLEPLQDENRKKAFREQVKKLKKKYHQENSWLYIFSIII